MKILLFWRPNIVPVCPLLFLALVGDIFLHPLGTNASVFFRNESFTIFHRPSTTFASFAPPPSHRFDAWHRSSRCWGPLAPMGSTSSRLNDRPLSGRFGWTSRGWSKADGLNRGKPKNVLLDVEEDMLHRLVTLIVQVSPCNHFQYRAPGATLFLIDEYMVVLGQVTMWTDFTAIS